jgi:hypothetical protein
MPQRNIVIVMCRCSLQKQPFGIRFEKRSGREWAATWAFAIKEAKAKKEGYDQAKIDGSFSFDPGYPGCPYCHNRALFLCGCGKVACWDGTSPSVTCPCCGATGKLSEEAVNSLTAGGDR